jgi:hypothetical protein
MAPLRGWSPKSPDFGFPKSGYFGFHSNSRYKKEPPVVRAALCFYSGVLFFHSHLCHPNQKLILNNKDDKKDDKKREAGD